MSDLDDLMEDLRQKRDELKLMMHLASKDAEDEWNEVMSDWHKFLSAAQFEKSADEVGDAARDLGLKMKAAFDRLKNAAD